MTATLDLVQEFACTVSRQASSVPYAQGQLLTLPWSLADGESISLQVQDAGGGVFEISDRGLAADSLSLAGVDLSTPANGRSWRAVRQSLADVRAPRFGEASVYELSANADRGDLGQALTEVAEAVLRADGLRILAGGVRRRRFADRVIERTSRSGLAVVPRAQIENKFGGRRQVTCRVEGRREESWALVQAVSGGGPTADPQFDHARSLFGDAKAPRSHLVSVVSAGARLDDWQISSLAEVSVVLEEDRQDQYWDRLAAA